MLLLLLLPLHCDGKGDVPCCTAVCLTARPMQVLPLLVITIATAFSTSSLFRQPTAIMSIRAAVDADTILQADSHQVLSTLELIALLAGLTPAAPQHSLCGSGQ